MLEFFQKSIDEQKQETTKAMTQAFRLASDLEIPPFAI